MLLSKDLLNKVCPSLAKYSATELEKAFSSVGIEVEAVINQKPIPGLQLAKIISVKKHPNKERLNVCQIEADKKILQIVCGATNVKENHYAILAPIGIKLHEQTIQAKEIDGILSQGMLCAYREISQNFSEFLSKKENDEEIILFSSNVVEDKNFDINNVLGLNDTIFDLFLPTNRNELNGVVFIANELKAFFNQNFVIEDLGLNEIHRLDVKIISKDVNAYNLFFIELNQPYFSTPWHWKKFLINSGIHITNTIADLANFTTLLTANPIHFYDANKIDSKIIVKNAENDENFLGLDNKQYLIKKGDLIICDQTKTIALAGIMGSLNSAVETQTTKIMCEIGNFNLELIKNSAQRLKIDAQAATLFSKQLSSNLSGIVWLILKNIVLKTYAKKTEPLFSFKNFFKREINLHYDEINDFLGINLKEKDVQEILARTGFIYQNNLVHVPTFRTDIFDLQDICEEILKSLNINDFKTQPINLVTKPISTLVSEFQQFQSLRDKLLTKQIFEVKTYNLTSLKEVQLFNWFNLEPYIKIQNPLSGQKTVLRLSLIHQMLEVLKFNLNRKQALENIFEIQRIHFKDQSFNNLCIILSTDQFVNLLDGSRIKANILNAKALFESLADALNWNKFTYEFEHKVESAYKKSSIAIKVLNQTAGFISQIDHSALKHYGLDNKNIFVLNLNLDLLMNNAPSVKPIKQISEFNPVYRALSFNLKKDFLLNNLIVDLKKIKYIDDAYLSDVFKKDEKVSYTVTVKIISYDHTLNASELDLIYQEMLNILKNHDLELK